MEPTARDQYLFTEVKTASAEKLHLLLIEGALRLANRARQYRQQGDNERALNALLEAQEIVAHLLGVIDHKTGGDLAARVSAIYEFVYRSLVKAGYNRDEASLGDAVRILEIERDTWRQVCEKAAMDRTTSGPAAPHFHFSAQQKTEESEFAGGFSLDA